MVEVFFYGLFMDINLLTKKGITAGNPRKASVKGYGLRIGTRATLLPAPAETAFGLIMELTDSDLQRLYAEPSVSDYKPEKIRVVTDENDQVDVICYNLPASMVTGSNLNYARELVELVGSLGFPDSYIQRLEKIATTPS